MDNYFIIQNVRKWIRGTEIEGNSILDLDKKLAIYMENILSYPKEEGEYISDLIFLKEHYFIISLNQAREWIKESLKYDESLLEISKIIDDKFPDIKDVRNMNEHGIGYFNNKGHKQKSFIRPVNHTIISDATSTIINNDGHYIGGRICVEEVVAFCSSIYPEVMKLTDFE